MKKKVRLAVLIAAVLLVCGWLVVFWYQGKEEERQLYENWKNAMLPKVQQLVRLYAAFEESGSEDDLEALIRAYDSAYENTKNIFEGGGMINLTYIAGWLQRDYPVWQKQAMLLELDVQNQWLYQGLQEKQPAWMLKRYRSEYNSGLRDILDTY